MSREGVRPFNSIVFWKLFKKTVQLHCCCCIMIFFKENKLLFLLHLTMARFLVSQCILICVHLVLSLLAYVTVCNLVPACATFSSTRWLVYRKEVISSGIQPSAAHGVFCFQVMVMNLTLVILFLALDVLLTSALNLFTCWFECWITEAEIGTDYSKIWHWHTVMDREQALQSDAKNKSSLLLLRTSYSLRSPLCKGEAVCIVVIHTYIQKHQLRLMY